MNIRAMGCHYLLDSHGLNQGKAMTTALSYDFCDRTRYVTMQAVDEHSDRSLVEQLLLQRDEKAFRAIVHRHGGMVYRVCLRILNRSQDAEDAFQATFLVFSQNLGSIRNRSSLASWLHGVARRTSFHLLAKAHSRRRRERQAARPDAVSPVEEAANQEIQAQIDQEVDRLPEALRQPLILCCLEGQSLEQAACQLGWTTSTLRRRLEKARHLLSLRLTRCGVLGGTALAAYFFPHSAALAAPSAPLVTITVQSALSSSPRAIVAAAIGCEPFSALAAAALPSVGWTKLQSACVVGLFALLFGFAAMAVTEPFAGATVGAPGEAPSKPVEGSLPAQANPQANISSKYGAFQAVAIAPNGQVIAAGGAKGQTVLWDILTGKVIQELKAEKPVMGMAFVGNEKTLALGTDQGGVEIWTSGPSGYSLKTRLGDKDQIVYAVAASADGATLAVGGHSGWTQLYDTSTWKPCGVLFERSNLTCSVAFANDGSFLATAGNSFRAYRLEENAPLWKANKLQPLTQVDTSTSQSVLWQNFSGGDVNDDASCADIAISPKMDLVAGVNGTSRHDDGGKTLYVWDAKSGKLRWKARATGMTTVVFAAQGKRIVTGSTDGKIRIWDAQIGKKLQEMDGHDKAVRNLATMQDDSVVFSAGEDGTVRIWDAQDGKLRRTFPKGD